MLVYLSTQSSLYPSTNHLSTTCQSICQSNHHSIQVQTICLPDVSISVLPIIPLSMYQPTVYQMSVYLSCQSSLYPCTNQLSTRCQSICPANHPSIHVPTTCLPDVSLYVNPIIPLSMYQPSIYQMSVYLYFQSYLYPCTNHVYQMSVYLSFQSSVYRGTIQLSTRCQYICPANHPSIQVPIICLPDVSLSVLPIIPPTIYPPFFILSIHTPSHSSALRFNLPSAFPSIHTSTGFLNLKIPSKVLS